MDTTPLPVYRHIAATLTARLDSGEFPPGSRLPAVRALAAEFGVNTLTALAAYRYLEQQQRVLARPRAGYFAALPAVPSLPGSAAPLPSAAALVDVSSRMSTLLQLGDERIHTQLHMAEAAASLYPAAELARRLQLTLTRQPELIGAHLPAGEQRRLLAALVRLGHERGLALDEGGILLTHGITEGISLALRHLTRPGDTVAVETPVYFGLLQTLEGLGLKALEIPCTPEAGLSLEALEFALHHGPAVKCLVCVPNFQNPTGALMPDDNKKRLLALARKHGVTVIEDDVFGDLHYGNVRPTPLKAWDRDGEVIYCASFTKSFAPSFRLGWLAAGRHHGALSRLCASSTLVSSPLLQVVLADVLDSGDYARISQRLRQQLAAQMTATADAVLRHFPRGTRVRRPQGGVVLWVECPETVDSTRLLQRALAEGISFAPGVAFSAAPRFGHCLRINCGQPFTPALAAAIARLGQLALAN
ncbi:aminotransferase-like domain-containing protein [Vogesella indigofera]|uniref:aminotransferase-like domain-containing protein n=1 Tax=Vogesella indigofera TaxID=45465 RepID=UPI00234C33DA|nr:PLP-dependent aminotransferase family protein [Vogesella indigofera]MDC7702804.1 PLP-dependent aminotransferase family protein [Vogesella indigofera]